MTDQSVTERMPRVRAWTWQLFHAVSYLHRNQIGHRDISIENVLLAKGEVRLMDFGQAVVTHTVKGEESRYFWPVGKPYYRGPECYVPAEPEVPVLAPPGARKGDVVFTLTTSCTWGDVRLLADASSTCGQPCPATPWGYRPAPNDVLACCVCIFIMMTGTPPWSATYADDEHFQWVQRDLNAALQDRGVQLPMQVVALMSLGLKANPSKRPSAEGCLQAPWFDDLRSTAVPFQEKFQLPEV
jgi:serine/threonine protein kinase